MMSVLFAFWLSSPFLISNYPLLKPPMGSLPFLLRSLTASVYTIVLGMVPVTAVGLLISSTVLPALFEESIVAAL